MLRLSTGQLSLLILIACSLGTLADNIIPQAVQWSSKSYGPDGPWHAVTVNVGTPAQAVDLLPGGEWSSYILAPSACNDDLSCAVAKEAGFYNSLASTTSFQLAQTGFVNTAEMQANWTFDTMSIPLSDGTVRGPYNAVVPDFDMIVISAANETLGDGTTYPVQIGSLALGAPHFNQTWLDFPPHPNWNGTLLTSWLYGEGLTPSNSYGLHIGSVALGIPGSLNIGGYDQSRVLGPVSGQVYSINQLPIDLLDVGIGVAEGGSPFNFTSQSGLLSAGNASIGVSLPVLVEAPDPYIYLPQSTCDAITRSLPVTFQEKYDLYLWNTADPNYNPIVSSPAFLSFTFRLNSSISQNLTINVPFALLNLTLTTPIVDVPTQYLPIRPGQGPSGSYELGRAFLQAAFLGVNWQTGNGVWFLAQAPGPNTPSDTPATTIGPTDDFIVGSTNSWVASWKGAWTVLPSTNTSSSGNTSTSAPKTNSSTNLATSSGLSHGAIFGIIISAFGALSSCIAVMIWIYRRRRQSSKGAQQQSSLIRAGEGRLESFVAPSGEASSREKYGSSGFGPRELDTGRVPLRPVEMEG